MLEKLPRSTNMKNLRAMLLLEAHFNALNEIIFNSSLMPKLEIKEEILLEIRSEYRT